MGELPQENPTVKNISFGIEGIFLGLFFFILVLLALNYFRVISLSFLYSKLSILPQKEQIVVQKSSTTSKNLLVSKDTLTVEEKAEKAGYKIAWKGSTEDGSGRAILASENRVNEPGWYDMFGWKNSEIYTSREDFYRGLGSFKRFEKISNSNDLYIVLYDEKNKEEFKARVLVDKTLLSSSVGGFEIDGSNRTRLLVENLNYGPNNKKIEWLNRIGLFSDIDRDVVSRLIKIGDIIVIYIIPLSEKEASGSSRLIRLDQEGIPAIINITIRRFNGISSIKQHLN